MSTDPVRLDRGWTARAMLLSQEAGWNQVAADWDVFMTHGTVFGMVDGERLVATAAALPYGRDFGWLSMVLVTAARRGRGIATRLVAACLAVLRDSGRAAFLDATPAGAPVYAKLGFAPVCGMARWHGVGGGGPTAGAADMACDTAAFGANRQFLLQDFAGRPGSGAVAAPGGFAVLRRGSRATQIGPLVAGPADAPALLDAAIGAAAGPVMIDVLEAGAALLPTLTARGYTEQRPFTRMALGSSVLPGDPARLLVAAGPEFG